MTPGMLDALIALLICLGIGLILWGIAEIVDYLERRFMK